MSVLRIVWVKIIDYLGSVWGWFLWPIKGLFGADFYCLLRSCFGQIFMTYLRGCLGLFCEHFICHIWP